MKFILAGALAFSMLAATAASARPHHGHQVCERHHHHRVCHWVR